MKPLLKIIVIFVILALPLSLNAKDKNYIDVKAERDISLSDLIRSSGFDLEDDKVVPFLGEFLRLNDNIKSLNLIPKGKTIRLPLRFLKTQMKITEKKGKGEVRKVVEEKDKIALLTRNIKMLFDRLGETITVRPGEVIIFPVTERASLSLDTNYFPVFELPGQHLIILDLRERLPNEIRDVIEVQWPEYTVISGRDLKMIINRILDVMDYSCLDDGRVIIGDEIQIEVKADCIVMRKGKDIMENDIIILSIIKEGEFGFPERFLKWAKDSGINIIDLPMKELRGEMQGSREARFLSLPDQKGELVVTFLTFLGYEVKRNVGLSLSERMDYRLNITADIAFKSGKRTKLIDLSGLPQPVVGLLRRHGIDAISIRPQGESREIILNILDFLSLDYQRHPETVSAIVTPRRVKYRVKPRGILVRTKRGTLLLSDYHNPELLRSLIDSRITLIKYK